MSDSNFSLVVDDLKAVIFFFQASSRSHCILELHFLPSKGIQDADAPEPLQGLLRVVDLAGSERNFETQMHSRSMAERGGLINYSLLMLKECARVMHNRKGKETEKHVPFRSSRLTHLLKSSFTDPSHMTTVVATLSPSPTDVEHSLNTLQHVGMMRSARVWEETPMAVDRNSTTSAGFDAVQGRGRALHSKLQDARKGQLNLHAFQMKTQVGRWWVFGWEEAQIISFHWIVMIFLRVGWYQKWFQFQL